MSKLSAGIIAYKLSDEELSVLLVHPGGPLWEGKTGYRCWSVPKGLVEDGEEPSEAAIREFCEETGYDCPSWGTRPEDAWFLGDFIQSPQKEIMVWALETDFDESEFGSNDFEMEWPSGSGNIGRFPENDDARWFAVSEAAERVFPGQRQVVEALAAELGYELEEE